MSTSDNPKHLILNVEDPNITEKSLFISLGHLYSGYSHKVLNFENSKSVLAAAYFLQIKDLCGMATKIISNNLNSDTICGLSEFFIVRDIVANDSNNGLITPPQNNALNRSHMNHRYGKYSEIITAACIKFLTRDIFEGVDLNGVQSGEYSNVLKVYTDLGFEWLKLIFSSKDLVIPNNIKYKFAQEVISKRKNTIHATLGEESVVLAFGSSASNVNLIRKAPRSKGVKDNGFQY